MNARVFDAILRPFLDARETSPQESRQYGLDRVSRVRPPEASRHVAEALPFLAMPLGEFPAGGALLEVRVPWLSVTLWMVPAETDVESLLAEGVSRGRIWTAAELMDFIAIADRTPVTVKTITHVKLATDGAIVDVRRR